jgi:hypothetical protein
MSSPSAKPDEPSPSISQVSLAVITLLFAGPAVSLAVAQSVTGEPTNAAEAAAKKAAEDERIDALDLAKVATLSPERQAWEKVLRENLGNAFDLPLHRRDFVSGKSTAWEFVANDPKLPRVLLIGDSISRGYTLPVRAALAGTTARVIAVDSALVRVELPDADRTTENALNILALVGDVRVTVENPTKVMIDQTSKITAKKYPQNWKILLFLAAEVALKGRTPYLDK